MAAQNPMVAEILEASASGFASAASVLLAQSPSDKSTNVWTGPEWKAHLTQRILELASAVRVDQPDLFVRRVIWLRRAMMTRGADDKILRAGLESLRNALQQELRDAFRSAVDNPIALALEALDTELEPELQALDASTPAGRLGFEYLSACLEARTEAAKALVLKALANGLAPPEIYASVLLPAQREIGQLWHAGDISVAEERVVSTTTRELMTLIVDRYAPAPDASRTVVLASVEGNAHDIGLRAVGDQFRLDGWRVIFLGADMPADDIAGAARSFESRLIVLSATLTTHLRNLAATIDWIKQRAGTVKILVGGLALQESPDLWQRLGADSCAATIDSAVTIGSQLVADA